MKSLYYLLTWLIVVAGPLLLVDCDDTIPSGLQTTVRGQVWDSVKQQPLEGVKIVLWACKTQISDMPGPDCNVVIDSVRTNDRLTLTDRAQGKLAKYQPRA